MDAPTACPTELVNRRAWHNTNRTRQRDVRVPGDFPQPGAPAPRPRHAHAHPGGIYKLGIGALNTLSRELAPAGPDEGGPEVVLAARGRDKEDLYCGIAAALVFGGVLTLDPSVVGLGLGFGFAVHCR